MLREYVEYWIQEKKPLAWLDYRSFLNLDDAQKRLAELRVIKAKRTFRIIKRTVRDEDV